MNRRAKLWTWLVVGIFGLGLIIYLLGPVLFASVVYPLPDQYRGFVAKYAQENNIDPNLLAGLIMVESGWNPNAHSGAGAAGMTQFIPSTAAGLAKSLGIPFKTQDLYNPETAIHLGAVYISRGIAQYNGDKTKALIAYNGGGGAVLAYNNGYPVGGTVSYARKVLGITQAYQAIYGDWYKNPSQATTAGPSFNVQPNRDLNVITSIDLNQFWKSFFNQGSVDQSTPANGDLNSFWKNLLPSQ